MRRGVAPPAPGVPVRGGRRGPGISARPSRRILFVCYTNPAGFPPVERAAAVLRDHGWDVRVLGTSGLATDAAENGTREGIDVRLISRGGSRFLQKLQFVRFHLWVLAHAISWRPEWVYLSDLLTAPFGVLAKRLRMRVVYHEHDAPAETVVGRFLRAAMRARRSLVSTADVVMTPSEGRSKALAKIAGRRTILTVPNCPLRREIREAPPDRAQDTLRLVYQGSIVPARLPVTLIDAMAVVAGPVELSVTGYETVGSQGHLSLLRRRAAQLGIEDQLHIFPVGSRELLLARVAQSDLGLALMPMVPGDLNEASMAGASNKAFEYLACGVPLLASSVPDWRHYFDGEGVALFCDPGDVAELARVLEFAIANRAELREMGVRGRAKIREHWNYETVFLPIIAVLDAVAARSDEASDE